MTRSMSEPLIVVTGAAGGLGSTVHRALLEAGKNTRATDRARAVSTSQPLIRGEVFSCLTMRDAADLILKVIDADLPGGRTYLPASRKNTQGLPAQEIVRKYYAGVALQKLVEEMESLVDLSTLTRDTGWEPRDLSQPEVETVQPTPRGLRARIFQWLPTSSLPLT